MSDPYMLIVGDCKKEVRSFRESSFDAIVTDPPYGLSFRGEDWDRGVPGVAFWSEFYRVLKPGGYLLAFGGSRTYHRLACAVEDAGFEVRDSLLWLYGSGFPKNMDISKALDKAAGAERERTGRFTARHGGKAPNRVLGRFVSQDHDPITGKMFETAPSTREAKKWSGWGTALKPAYEPIILARKPFRGTVVQNILDYGTGALNTGATRVPRPDLEAGSSWPSNVIFDGSEESFSGLPEEVCRYFYCPKATRKDRDEGLEALEVQSSGKRSGRVEGSAGITPYAGGRSEARNPHPTVKPTVLMRHLCRLVIPEGGVVLDPFAGSGSTGKAAILEGFNFVGIEKDPDHATTALLRLAAATKARNRP